MKISQLYIYPIKSLRPTAVSQSRVTHHGMPYDRRFMLLKKDAEGGLSNMHVGRILAMALFSTDIIFPTDDNDAGKIVVTYRPPIGDSERADSKTLEIPLQPSTEGLETVQILMHSSPTTAFSMPTEYNAWFSACFGFDVILAYVGENRRPVLGNLLPKAENGKSEPKAVTSGGGGGWLASIAKSIPYIGSGGDGGGSENVLTFTDIAPYLVISETSLDDVSSRLPEGEEMDVTKFRPNIVVSGADTAFEEDYWAEIVASDKEQGERDPVRFALTGNCARCKSINVDFDTGVAGTGESGSVLKKLMNNRRIDRGTKYSPIFGRYGFLGTSGDGDGVVTVGDEVEVSRRNDDHTTFDWPKLSN